MFQDLDEFCLNVKKIYESEMIHKNILVCQNILVFDRKPLLSKNMLNILYPLNILEIHAHQERQF